MLLTNLHNINFLSSWFLRNLSRSSIVFAVPLPLVAFSALSYYYISLLLFKQAELFRVNSFRFFFHVFLKMKDLVLLLFLSLYCIISLLRCIIQLLFQLFCMALQCLALDRNYPHGVIFDLFSDMFLSSCELFSPMKIWFIIFQHANITFQFDNIQPLQLISFICLNLYWCNNIFQDFNLCKCSWPVMLWDILLYFVLVMDIIAEIYTFGGYYPHFV